MRKESFASVMARFGLRQVISHYGHAPAHEHKWKSFPKCPFCGQKDCAGVFQGKGGDSELFKCHHSDCSSGRQVVNAVGYVALATGLSDKRSGTDKLSPAAVEFLKIAGAWEEKAESRKQKAESHSDEPEPEEVAEMPGVEPTAEEVEAAFREADSGEEKSEIRNPKSEGNPKSEIRNPNTDGEAEELTAESGKLKAEIEDAGPEAGAPAEAPVAVALEEGDALPAYMAALRAFYDQLTLSDADAQMLWRKRGILPEVAERLGLVSSPRANRAILEALPQTFSLAALLDAGLWVRDQRRAKPNSKFFGVGVAGRNRRPEQGEWVDAAGETVYGWVHPVLIPYFDAEGRLVALRPHKDNPSGVQSHLYVPRAKAESGKQKAETEKLRRNMALITEGEFKAAAADQVFNGPGATGEAVAVAALPGIQMLETLWADILTWLEDELDPRAPVVVCYDNEEKGDPRLPGFKPDKWKRYDSVIWARLLARRLKAEGYDARVGMLPVEWRDAKGKADWDGALAERMN